MGAKVLTIPAVSNTFTWTAQQVAKIGNYKQPIYILAQEPLAVSLDSDVSLCSYIYRHQYIACNNDKAESKPIILG